MPWELRRDSSPGGVEGLFAVEKSGGAADSGDSGSYVSSLAVNQGWARICGIIKRFVTSFTRIFLIKFRDSANDNVE